MSPCLWGKPPKRVFLDVSEDVFVLFCVADVALCDSRCVSAGMCVRDHREGKVAVSMGKTTKNVSFSTCQKMCSWRFAWQAWHFVTLYVFQQECVCATVVRVKLPCLWGKPQKSVFLDASEDVVMSFCVAGLALCDIPGAVCEEECVCATIDRVKLPGLWGKPPKRFILVVPEDVFKPMGKATKTYQNHPKPFFLVVSEDVLMAFCVAGVALCDIRCVSAGMCVRDRREGKVAVSMGKATKKCLSRRVRKCGYVVLRGRRGRRGTLWHSMCFSAGMCARDRCEGKVAVSMGKATKTCCAAGVALCDIRILSRCVRRKVCARPSWGYSCRAYGESHQNLSFSSWQKMCSCRFAWQVWHFALHCPLYTLNSHFTLHTPHSPLSTLHTLHSTLCTSHSTLSIPHFTLHIPHFTLRTPHLHLILLALTSVSFTWCAFGFAGFSCFGYPVLSTLLAICNIWSWKLPFQRCSEHFGVRSAHFQRCLHVAWYFVHLGLI